MNKTIIDADPGVDDALAIAFALCSPLDIEGITTVFGNVAVEQSTQNALQILEVFDAQAGVYMGSKRPLKGKPTLASSHGITGLGNMQVRPTSKKRDIAADAFIIQTLQEASDPIDIVAIGPATNIANVITSAPELLAKIRQIVVVAGVFGQPGNISDVAEFNAYNDPLALQIVLDSSVKTVLIPADVCRNVMFTLDTFNSIANPKIKESMAQVAAAYISYYQNQQTYGTFSGGVMYDLLAIAYLLEPDLFRTLGGSVQVCTTPGLLYGQTTVSTNGTNCIVRDVDGQKLTKLFLQTINRASGIAV